MKNRVLKALVIFIIIIVSIGILNNSYAVSVCTIKGAFSPSNPQPGQEITIDISATEINEAIAGVSFTLEYDAEKFDIVSANATDLWEISQIETQFTILTKNYEATKNTGKIATIKLKVKENAAVSETTIKLLNIEATTDDMDSVTIGEISQQISITSKEGQKEIKPSENENTSAKDNKTNVEPDNGNNKENTNNGNNNQNQQFTEKPTTSTEVDSNKIVVVNGNTNSSSSTKAESTNKDATTTNKSLPKTGLTMIYHIAIVVAIIGMGAGFISYRKYKNI